jgi:hypothetical protein
MEAGHHRVAAAIRAGVKTADLFVGDIDMEGMIRIYARENVTQRGQSGTAQVGSVAAALRFRAKRIMLGHLSGFPETCQKARETLQGQIGTTRGLGEPIITELLRDIPDINETTVAQQLAVLNSSGYTIKANR